MNKIYLITGPAGVGKSTVSKLLAEKLEKSVLIEGDDVYHFVVGGYVAPWKNGNHLDLFWKNSKSLIKNSLESGFDVVFNYILDKKQIKEMQKEFKDCEIKFVCLMTDEETILKRDKERPEDCQMGERCLVLLESFKKKNFDERNILNTSNLSISETLEEVLENDRFVLK